VAKRTYTDEQLADAVKNSTSLSEVCKVLGIRPTNYRNLKVYIQRHGYDMSHFTGRHHMKGKKHNWSPKKPLDEILVENSKYLSSRSLKKRLLKEEILTYECAICKLFEWMGKKIMLQLDHINGVNTDNRIENLRLLCPNCHSQTDTYCGRNVAWEKQEPKNKCGECGAKTRKNVKLCLECYLASLERAKALKTGA
jgi:5-methylcytosine-specific restriction endonuclease McrA